MIDHLLEFVGRTHLVLLHFPIALIVCAAAVELFRAVRPRVQRTANAQAFVPGSAGTTLFRSAPGWCSGLMAASGWTCIVCWGL